MKALNVEKLDLLNDEGVVMRSRYDALIDRFLTEEAVFLDSGATAFLPFWTFIVESDVGEIEREGKTFDQMQVFLNNREKVLTSIGIPQRSPDLYGSDIRHMRERKLTFDEAISEDPEFNIVEKYRLNRVRRELLEQLVQTPFA
jgi:hypothetical protein